MALDDRIVAAAPSCYITSLERLFATIGPQDAEQNITGQVAFGMEHADYLTMRAPRPTLICVGTQDFFDIEGAWTTFREAKRIYGMLGHGERVDLFEYDDKHGFSKPRREAAMRWMRRWLLDKDDAVVETDFPVASDPQMLCTASGQVLAEFKGRSAFDLNADDATALAALRSKAPPDTAMVRRLLALADVIEPAEKISRGVVEADAYRVQKLVFKPAEGIPLPALLFSPAKVSDRPLSTVIYLHEQGKAAGAGPDGEIAKLVAEDRRVLAIDLRGWGETSPGRPPANRPGTLGADNKEFFLSVHLNRPLLGQRVYDVLSIIASLAKEGVGEVELIGVGAAGPIALHAAALDPRIRRHYAHAFHRRLDGRGPDAADEQSACQCRPEGSGPLRLARVSRFHRSAGSRDPRTGRSGRRSTTSQTLKDMTMQRRDFLRATAALSIASMWADHAEAAGIADQYAGLATERYLRDLKTVAKVEDSKIFTEGPCCDRAGNVFFTNTQALEDPQVGWSNAVGLSRGPQRRQRTAVRSSRAAGGLRRGQRPRHAHRHADGADQRAGRSVQRPSAGRTQRPVLRQSGPHLLHFADGADRHGSEERQLGVPHRFRRPRASRAARAGHSHAQRAGNLARRQDALPDRVRRPRGTQPLHSGLRLKRRRHALEAAAAD